ISLLTTAGMTIATLVVTASRVAPTVQNAPISASALRQMEQLLREKDARRPAPRGIGSITERRAATPPSTWWGTLGKLTPVEATLSAAGPIGTLRTEGDVTHAANQARLTYGVAGAGVRVGVLSDSAEEALSLMSVGALPAGTTIVEDLKSGRGTSKGTAMM